MGICRLITWAVCIFCLQMPGVAQRKMENLGRGVVAINKGNSQVYVSWRMLGSDPPDIAFNLYRSVNSAAPVKLNTTPITATTDYTDIGVDLTKTNAYFVKPVINSMEQAASTSFTIPAGTSADPFIKIPLQPCPEGGFYVHLAWTGDLDGDGEYDYVVDRLPLQGVTGTIKLDAYKSDGTFMWRIDLGPNTAISDGHNDGVTVYDLDGDGKAEVIMKSGLGTVFYDNAMTVENKQFISVVNGQTGAELARTELTGGGHMAVAYLDGINPSVVFEYKPTTNYFDLHIRAFDYKNGAFTPKPWEWVMPSNHDHHAFHQIRIMDVDLDGKDEICEGGFVIDDNGQSLYANECVHGDRFHITDFDPDRPGLEFFSIQQDNPKLLSMLYFDAATGQPIKRYYSERLADVGRGAAGDIDPTSPGMEFWSTQPGVYSSKGELLYTNKPAGNPNFCIWWDGDLLREHLYDTRIDKWDYVNKQSQRLLTAYQTGAIATWRDAPPLYGDLFGDWREEILYENSTHTQLQIYTTTIPASTRMYTLMHNPGYRNAMCAKGYYQTNHPDFFVGDGMDKPPVSPVFTGDVVWKGDIDNNWDTSTQNWQLQGVANTFSDGKKVLFDISGANADPVNIASVLQPGDVIVSAPHDYIFEGSGRLSGTMSLTKAGWGTLTINNHNDYTGTTTVDAGALIVNGNLDQSNVVVESRGKIGGKGHLKNGLTLNSRASVLPGNGTAEADTLFVTGSFTVSGNNTLHFDISDDPVGTSKTNDIIHITGDLVVSGSNTIAISLIDGSPGAGAYTLMHYSGTLTGNLSGFTVNGLEGHKYALSSTSNSIVLTIDAVRAPASVTWTGSSNSNWDVANSSNFSNGTTATIFAPGDNVVFDNTSSVKNVALTGSLRPSSVTVNNSDYTFDGSGSIIGAGGLTKSGTGTLTITARNAYSGATVVNGGTLQVNNVSNGGEAGTLGASASGSANFVLNGGAFKYSGITSNTDRGITLETGNGTLEVVNLGVNLVLTGAITGAGQLIKTGAGMLTLVNANSFTGGVTLKEGILNLGSFDAIKHGTGTGTVTLEGGELWLFDTHSGDLDNVWYESFQNMIVPTGKSARINASGRSLMYGTLTGSGDLTFYVPFIRTELNGNWSAFSGRINVIADGDGGDFRINNNAGYANASINLGDKVAAYHKTSGAQSVAIGEISGTTLSVMTGENWTVGGKNTDAIFNGLISGNSITKTGTGMWTLTNANTYAGGTTIKGGTLMVKNTTGSATGTGAVAVQSTGRLSGTGTIAGAVSVAADAAIAPGDNGIGTLTINNNLVLSAGSTAAMEVKKSPVASDKLQLTGNVVYGGTLAITNMGATSFTAGDKFQLFQAAGYQGKFGAISPETPGDMLYWDSLQLTVDGSLSVRGRQVITFELPVSLSNTNPDHELSATTNAGLPVQYTSSDPQIASIITEQGKSYLRPVSAGTVSITASQPGMDGWDAAEPVTREVAIEITTDVEELYARGIHVYPNPVADKLYVSLPQQNFLGRIYIYSSAGQLVYETQAKSQLTIIPLSQMRDGEYTVKITLSGGTFATHIIKGH